MSRVFIEFLWGSYRVSRGLLEVLGLQGLSFHMPFRALPESASPRFLPTLCGMILR